MLERRMTMLPFLGAWVVLVVGLVFALLQAMDGNLVLALPVGVVSYLLFVPIYMWRANDLGRPRDEAVWLCLPVVGQLYGIMRLTGPTPSNKARDKAIRRWKGQITGGEALLLGFKRLLRVSWLAVPLVLLLGVVQTLVGEELLQAARWLLDQPDELQEMVSQALGVGAGLLGIYSLFQVVKRKKATRISWIPTLFMLPLALAAGGIILAKVGGSSTQPAVIALVDSAWMLVFMCFGGASLMVAWATLAQQLEEGQGIDALAVVRRMLTRTADVSAPYGAKTHAVIIGFQVVIPGIFYALQMAFVGIAAVLEPDQPALSRSARLTYGIRTRVLKALLLPFVLSLAAGSGAVYLIEGQDMFIQSLIVPGSGGLWSKLAGDVLNLLVFSVATLGLVEMFRQRAARFEKKDSATESKMAPGPTGSPWKPPGAAETEAQVSSALAGEPSSPDTVPAGGRTALVVLGLILAASGGLLLAYVGTGAAMVSTGVAVAALPLLLGTREA